jgi:hypothetical protein
MGAVGAKMVINVAFFGFFLLIVFILGFFLWQTLFASDQYRGAKTADAAYSEQHSAGEKGATAPSEHANSAEEAVAEYTRWLAFFTAALVLATIALFVSGERMWTLRAARPILREHPLRPLKKLPTLLRNP